MCTSVTLNVDIVFLIIVICLNRYLIYNCTDESEQRIINLITLLLFLTSFSYIYHYTSDPNLCHRKDNEHFDNNAEIYNEVDDINAADSYNKIDDAEKHLPRPINKRKVARKIANDLRGTQGLFYVECDRYNKCGQHRNKIIQLGQTGQTGQTVGSTNTYCLNKCKDGIDNDTVSLYNDEYIDTDVITCYGCPLDRDTKAYYRNYLNFPYINGPPGDSLKYVST